MFPGGDDEERAGPIVPAGVHLAPLWRRVVGLAIDQLLVAAPVLAAFAAAGHPPGEALDGDTMVFVEVKERRAGLDWALTSLSPEKVQRLFAAAETYIAQSDWSGATRFDAVLVGPREIEHLPGGLTLSD